MKRLFWFAVAGGTGFAVDAGVLQLLLWLTPLGPLVARVFSIAAAMFATWVINRGLTFGRSSRHVAAEGVRYVAVALVAAAINYLLYSAFVLTLPDVWPVLGVAFSSAGAMIFSYLGYSRLVFGR